MEEGRKTTKEEMRAGIRGIWRHVKPFRGQLKMLIILGLVSAVANGFMPYLTGRFFDALIHVSQHNTQYGFHAIPLWVLFLVLWALVQLLANNIDWVMDRMRRRLDEGIQFNIQVDGFVHLYHLPLAYHKSAHVSGEIEKISRAAWRIAAIMRTIISIAPQLLSILIGISLAASISPLLAGILFLGVLVYVGFLVNILSNVADTDSRAHRSWNDAWGDAAQAVHQIESIKNAAAEEHESTKVRVALLDRTYKLWDKLELTWSNVNFFQRIIVFGTQLMVFVLSVHLVASGSITIGELVALNGYSLMFFGPFVTLGYSWQTIQNGITSAALAEEVFNAPEENYHPEGALPLPHIKGKVEFDQVNFQYGEKGVSVLRGINMQVLPGDTVALVGESGVGKSTSIGLISGYYFPSEGSVKIDGVDTRQVNLSELRRQIAIVPQEVALFNDSIKENIRYGSFDASEDDVVRVAKALHIDTFIDALPEKYDTLVGERGVKLSVGQKQRVAIARAMLRDPAILILDEPTSALDAHTEQVVTEALEKLMSGRTTFIIAHRLSTVRKAKLILVFKDGMIAESGTHGELIANEGGIYRRLHDYQIGLH